MNIYKEDNPCPDFTLKINSTLLRENFEALTILVDEATIALAPDGLRLRQMDASRVAMINWHLLNTACEKYDCYIKGVITFNTTELLKILKRTIKITPNGETITTIQFVELSIDKEKERLNITLLGRYTRTFSTPLLESPSDDPPPLPIIKYHFHANVVSEDLKDLIDDANLVSDHMKLTGNNNSLSIDAAGDINKVHAVMVQGDPAVIDLKAEELSKANYSLSYLSEMIKVALKLAENVTLEYASDMPIKLDFTVKTGVLTFHLAPRIETD